MKKQPFFKKNSLIFRESGHSLTLSDRHYRCILKCKKKCNESESQTNAKDFERTFSRLAKKFVIDEKEFNKLYRQMLREYLPVMLIEAEDVAIEQEELLEATLDVMRQEAEEEKKLEKSDIEDFKNSDVKVSNARYSLVLLAYLVATISIFSKIKSEKHIGKTLELITKHVYLSNDGKIIEIELEKWGWYILYFIDRKHAGYILNLRENGVKIKNEKEPYCDFDPLRAIAYFQEQGIEIAISDYSTLYFYGLLTKMQGVVEELMKADTGQISKALVELFEQFQKDPQLEFAKGLSVITGRK